MDAKLNSVSRFVNELRILNKINVFSDNKISSLWSLLIAINIEHKFDCTADQLWAVIGTPDRVDWVPGVEGCEYDGEVRSLSLPGAGAIKERIISRDAVARTMVYSCFESPTPLEFHEARVEIIPAQRGCTLYWQTLVEPVEIEVFIKASMEGCLVQISQVIEQSRST
ncbi:MAG: SRPBCC family protein [Porticoccaceae bacterium]|nr:SRPBCC family protein [Porticoccaceae bacterium]